MMRVFPKACICFVNRVSWFSARAIGVCRRRGGATLIAQRKILRRKVMNYARQRQAICLKRLQRKIFLNFFLDFRNRCSKLPMVLKTNSLLLEGMGKIKEPTPSKRELSSARVLHAPVPLRRDARGRKKRPGGAHRAKHGSLKAHTEAGIFISHPIIPVTVPHCSFDR